MIKRTKHGKISRGSEHGESPCKDCSESTIGEEVILIFYQDIIHVDRHHTRCFLNEDPHYKVCYEIVMATMAMNGVPRLSYQGDCDLCGMPTRREDIITCSISGDINSRKFFAHLSCFMGTSIVRHAPNVHIGRM